MDNRVTLSVAVCPSRLPDIAADRAIQSKFWLKLSINVFFRFYVLTGPKIVSTSRYSLGIARNAPIGACSRAVHSGRFLEKKRNVVETRQHLKCSWTLKYISWTWIQFFDARQPVPVPWAAAHGTRNMEDTRVTRVSIFSRLPIILFPAICARAEIDRSSWLGSRKYSWSQKSKTISF